MITINLLRISPDSQYLEFSVEAPENYKFNKLNIKKYDWERTIGYPTCSDGWLDANLLYTRISNKEVMRIATSIFKGSSMFYVEFGVEWVGETEETLNYCGNKLSDTTTIGVCSDINGSYQYLLSSILSLNSNCPTISDELKRYYMILYAHIEALKLEKFMDAEYFYDILKLNGSTCGNPISNITNTSSCNCN